MPGVHSMSSTGFCSIADFTIARTSASNLMKPLSSESVWMQILCCRELVLSVLSVFSCCSVMTIVLGRCLSSICLINFSASAM